MGDPVFITVKCYHYLVKDLSVEVKHGVPS